MHTLMNATKTVRISHCNSTESQFNSVAGALPKLQVGDRMYDDTEMHTHSVQCDSCGGGGGGEQQSKIECECIKNAHKQ